MILVTGGTGLIGSELIRQLVASGEPVRMIYRDPSSIEPLQIWKNKIEFVQADILDITELDEVMKGITQVFHCAGNNGRMHHSYEELMKTNVEGTANVVNAMLYRGVKRILYVSALPAIGGIPEKTVNEETRWEKNKYVSSYALSMTLGEREIWRGGVEGLDVIVVNAGTVLGIDRNRKSRLTELVAQMQKGRLSTLNGCLNYVDVRDLAEVMIRLMKQQEIADQRYIVVAGSIPVQQFLEAAGRSFRLDFRTVVLGKFSAYSRIPFDQLRSWATGQPRKWRLEEMRYTMAGFRYDSAKLKAGLDYTFTPLESTLARLAAEIR